MAIGAPESAVEGGSGRVDFFYVGVGRRFLCGAGTGTYIHQGRKAEGKERDREKMREKDKKARGEGEERYV